MKVKQLDYDTGELIDIYSSTEEAALDNYLNERALLKALKCKNGRLKDKKLLFAFVVPEEIQREKIKRLANEIKQRWYKEC